MKKITKKGFTLIELMIVLAIIAILAVVLVPKAGQMKDNARNAGITTNVNAVRGTLEAKVVDTNYLGSFTNTATLLKNTFAGDTALANPFNAKGLIVNSDGYEATRSDALLADHSIDLFNKTTAVGNLALVAGFVTPVPSITAAKVVAAKGIVFVYVFKDGYVVFGVDSTGTVVNKTTIK